MSRNIQVVSLLVVLCITGFSASKSFAESPSGKTEDSHQTKWEYYNQYARWSFGANIGTPFFAGNFQSKAYDKLYWVGVLRQDFKEASSSPLLSV